MGDEPYAMMLPWVFFAIVARTSGEGVVWAGIAAAVTATTIVFTTRHPSGDNKNVLAIGAILWFSALAIAALAFPHGWLVTNARAVSALGWTAISLVSLTFVPTSQFYLRQMVQPRYWHDERFTRLNVHITLLFAATFSVVAGSHVTATWIDAAPASTVFNWIAPVLIYAIAAYYAGVLFRDVEEASAADVRQHGALHDLELDWQLDQIVSEDW